MAGFLHWYCFIGNKITHAKIPIKNETDKTYILKKNSASWRQRVMKEDVGHLIGDDAYLETFLQDANIEKAVVLFCSRIKIRIAAEEKRLIEEKAKLICLQNITTCEEKEVRII